MVLTFTGSLSAARAAAGTSAGDAHRRDRLQPRLGTDRRDHVPHGLARRRGRNALTFRDAARTPPGPRRALAPDRRGPAAPVVATILAARSSSPSGSAWWRCPSRRPSPRCRGATCAARWRLPPRLPFDLPGRHSVLLMRDAMRALRVSNAVAIFLLFLRRLQVRPVRGLRPWLTGIVMVVHRRRARGAHDRARRMRLDAGSCGGAPRPARRPPRSGRSHRPRRPPEGPRPAWEFNASVYGYFPPEDTDYGQPTVMADRGSAPPGDPLQLRGHRHRFRVGRAGTSASATKLRLDATLMAGGVFGKTEGRRPGLRADGLLGPFELYSEGEYVFDVEDSDDDFFYNWAQLGYSPLDWLTIGFASPTVNTRAAPSCRRSRRRSCRCRRPTRPRCRARAVPRRSSTRSLGRRPSKSRRRSRRP